jgi:hypothetical protein
MAELCCCCCMSVVDVSCLLRPWLCCLVDLGPRGVKDSLHELGCVDEHGINLSELDSAAWRTFFCPWKRCVYTSQLREHNNAA